MTSPPRISVVIPAFNAERFLAEAIDSVLGQTLPAAEVVVVDDFSSDATGEVAAGYPGVTLLRIEPNRGPAEARNAGLGVTTGELICFHDADDVMLPAKLEVQAAYLDSHPEAGGVIGSQEIFQEDGAGLPFWHRETDAAVRMPPERAAVDDPTQIHPMTIMVWREAFDRVGPFDAVTAPAEDVDWMLRAAEAGVEIARLEEVLVRRRVHPGSLTQDALVSRQAIFRAVKAKIDRGRTER
jgi:glycosyltransferase involved in cell wall biosynthesis